MKLLPRCLSLPPALALAAAPALAGAGHQEPGSLLVLPLVDARAGVTSLVTLTNTHPGNDDYGTVDVSVFFVDGTTLNTADRTIRLGPGDTKTVVGSYYAFVSPSQGFAYAFAKRWDGRPMSYDYLIGSVLVIDGNASTEFSIPAIAFDGMPAYLASTDVDNDGIKDLNGVEYAQPPNDLKFPVFYGQTPSWRSELVLVSLTGGRQFTSRVTVIARNDMGEQYSSIVSVRGWKRAGLAEVSALFNNDFLRFTNHDANESVLGVETGWFSLHGLDAKSNAATFADPAILAVLIEPRSASSAMLPFATGQQGNGDLWPAGIFGDTN